MRASGSTTASGRSSEPKTAVPPQSSRGSSNDTAAAVSATDPRLRLLSIVHDFNNLLTPIVTILEELQGRHVGTSRQLKKIDGAIYCVFCAKVLARQLLDFANPRPASPKPVRIRGLLEPLETALASILSPDIRPKFDITEELPPAFIDRQLVERALLNLVLKARDAMPEGGDVTITAALEFPPASYPGGPRADHPPFCRRLGGGDGSPDAEDGGTAEFLDEDQWHRSWPRDRQATDGKFGWWTLNNKRSSSGHDDRSLVDGNTGLLCRLTLPRQERNNYDETPRFGRRLGIRSSRFRSFTIPTRASLHARPGSGPGTTCCDGPIETRAADPACPAPTSLMFARLAHRQNVPCTVQSVTSECGRTDARRPSSAGKSLPLMEHVHGWRRTRRKGQHSLSRFPFARPRRCPRTTEKIPVGLCLHCR